MCVCVVIPSTLDTTSLVNIPMWTHRPALVDHTGEESQHSSFFLIFQINRIYTVSSEGHMIHNIRLLYTFQSVRKKSRIILAYRLWLSAIQDAHIRTPVRPGTPCPLKNYKGYIREKK